MSEYMEHDGNGVSVGVVEKKSFMFAHPPSEMTLENGSTLGPVTLAYETSPFKVALVSCRLARRTTLGWTSTSPSNTLREKKCIWRRYHAKSCFRSVC